MKEIFFAKAKDGLIEFSNKNALFQFLVKLEGKSLWVEIQDAREKRSLDQNAWYWGVVLKTIAESVGHTENELHEIFKRMFLPPKTLEYRGREIKIPGTTTELSKGDFSEYIEKVRAEVSSLGIIIPDPI